MTERKRTKADKPRAARLTMDAEALCAILARIIARLVSEQRPRKAKA